MSGTQTYYNRLGLSTNATVDEVRSAYKSLALQQHPDKVPESNREQANEAFKELLDAYIFCLSSSQGRSHGRWENSDNDSQDDPDDDGSDWRGRLPVGIGGSGLWWDELTGNEPVTVLRWANVCKKTIFNAPRLYAMSKTERDLLNEEYAQAYHRFETWRQKHIDKFEQADRLHQDWLDSIPAGLGQSARVHFEELHSWLDDETESSELTKAEERAFYKLPDPLKIPSKTWRDNHNSATSVPAQVRLEQFERQAAATDARGILDRPYNKEKQRAKVRAITANHLIAELKEEKEIEMEKKQARRARKLLTGPKGTLPGDMYMVEQGYARDQAGGWQKATASLEPVQDDADEPVDYKRGSRKGVGRIAVTAKQEEAFWDNGLEESWAV